MKKIKTVDVTCPSFDSFFQSCDTEDSLPLTKSAARLARIFAEEEVAVSKMQGRLYRIMTYLTWGARNRLVAALPFRPRLTASNL